MDTVVTKLESIHDIYASVSAYSNGLLTYSGSVDVNAAVDVVAFAEVGADITAVSYPKNYITFTPANILSCDS